MRIYKNLTDTVGNTPLLELGAYGKKTGAGAKILAKLEYFNPAGSVKDRAALYMINDAEKRGLLKKGSVIIEPTSGNTGIGLAMVAASRGYRTILTMPDSMSEERRKLLRAYGAELVLTDGALGMRGAIDAALKLSREIENSFIPSQFENAANVRAHYETTGPEIYGDTGGEIAVFVAGVGTGGTLTGVSKYLKEKNKNIRVVAVEPSDSPFLSHGVAASHKIQGIGAGFKPEILDTDAYDEIICVSTEDAYRAAQALVFSEGLLVGVSSGAALHAASVIAKREEYKNKSIVVLFPDGGEKYLSVEGFVK